MNKTIVTTSIAALVALSALSSCSSSSTAPYSLRELAWNSFTLVSVPASQTEPMTAAKPDAEVFQVAPTQRKAQVITKSTSLYQPTYTAPKQETVPVMPGRGRSLRSY